MLNGGETIKKQDIVGANCIRPFLLNHINKESWFDNAVETQYFASHQLHYDRIAKHILHATKTTVFVYSSNRE